MASGPIVIAFDGSAAAQRAIREAGPLLAVKRALVVVVWKAGVGFELVALPTASVGLPPAEIDVRTALEIDRAHFERAQRLAEQGAQLARDAGFEPADALAAADDVDTPIHETIVRVARERAARAIVAGSHSHAGIAEMLGSITRGIVRMAPCPVLLDRERSG